MRRLLAGFVCASCGFVAGFAAATRWQPGSGPATARNEESAALRSAEILHESATLARSAEAAAAVLALAEKRRDPEGDHAFCAALERLDAAGFRQSAPQMLEVLRRLGAKHAFAKQVGEAWMERWLEVDAAGALEFLGASRVFDELDPKAEWGDAFTFGLSFEGVFSAVARKAPEWARSSVARMKADATRNCGVYHVALAAGREMERGPSKQLISEFLEGANRGAALQGYVTGLADRDPAEAWSLALAEPKGPLREKLMHAVLWSAAATGANGVRSLIEGAADPRERAERAALAIGNVAHRTRENVFPWLKEEIERAGVLGGSEFDSRWGWALQCAFRGDDFPGAANWALDLKSDPKRTALTRLIFDWVATEPESMRAWLITNAGQFDSNQVAQLKEPLTRFGLSDPKIAAEWVASLPPGPLHDAMRFQAALTQAKRGGAEQAQAVYASISAEDKTGEMARMVAEALVTQNPESAGAWALNLAPGKQREEALRNVARQWTRREPEAAANWITQVPPGSERDLLIQEFAAGVAANEPSSAAEWVLEIADPTAREKAADGILWIWRMEDPAAAAAWMQSLPGVSEAWRAKVRKRP